MNVVSREEPPESGPLLGHIYSLRVTRWPVLVAAPLAWTGVTLICLGALVGPATKLGQATAGLVQPTLQFAVLLMACVIGGIVWLAGGTRPRDLGWGAGKAWTGIAFTAAVWLAVQLVTLAISVIGGRPLAINSVWSAGQWTFAAGALVSQLLGNALAEETMFRGFLLPQLYLKLGGSRDHLQKAIMAWAVIISQLCFALLHIPNLHRLGTVAGHPVGKLLVIFALGVFFALLYLRTGNLFVVVGVHALINTPAPVFSGPEIFPQAAVFVVAVLALAVWPRRRGRWTAPTTPA